MGKEKEKESIDGVWELMGKDKQVGSFLTVPYRMYECMIPMCSYIIYPFFCLRGLGRVDRVFRVRRSGLMLARIRQD